MCVADEKGLPELLKGANPALVIDVLGGYMEATLVPAVVAGLDTGVEGFEGGQGPSGKPIRRCPCDDLGKVSRTGKFSGSIEAM